MTLVDDSPLRDQLGADERLLWSDQPRPGVRLRAVDLVVVPFTLMWAGFAFFWEYTVLRTGAPWFFKLWGIPFVLIGVYLVAGRFFWDAYQRSRTYYGLSNQRVLIVTRGSRLKVKSLALATLGEVTVSSSADGWGSIQFGSSPWGKGTPFAGANWPGAQGPPSFEMIADAGRVHEMIRQAQHAERR